jgi:hypothetical protein
VIEIGEGEWRLNVLTFRGRVSASEQGELFAERERWLATEQAHVGQAVAAGSPGV